MNRNDGVKARCDDVYRRSVDRRRKTPRGVVATLLRLVGVLAVGTIVTLSSCQSIADRRAAGAPRLVSPPDEAAPLTDPTVPIEVDPGETDPTAIVAVRIEVYEGDAAVTEYRVAVDGSRLAFDLPLRGLQDRRTYRFQLYLVLRAGTERAILDPFTRTLAFGLPVPRVETEPHATFDPTPTVSWELPLDEEIAGTEVEIVDPTGSVRSSGELDAVTTAFTSPDAVASASEIERGTELRWRGRIRNVDGVYGEWSSWGTLRMTTEIEAARPRTAYDGVDSIVAEPGLVWAGPAGATSYRVEVLPARRETREPIDDLEPLIRRTDRSRIRISPGEMDELLRDAPSGHDGGVVWRVVATNELGNRSPASPWFFFRYRPLMPTMEPVMRSAAAVLLGNSDSPNADERPVAVVPIPAPFAMSRYEITVDVAARVFDALVVLGEAEIVTESDGNRLVVHSETGRPLIGLGALDYGRQFSIVASDAGRIRPGAGYSSHPAVGVSWYGAVVLANALSELAAREPVYEVSSVSVITHYERDGYRLPTEAEWAYAAALGNAAEAPAGSAAEGTVVAEKRAISPVELRGANYQRSGDRWEDVNAPYTRNGGPTTPVGALGFTNPAGIADLFGNVWEWTNDWYDPGWYRRVRDTEVADAAALFHGPAEPVPDLYGQELKVVRGGAWNTPPAQLRPTGRGTFRPEAMSHSIGIRLVRTLSRTPVQDARSN